MPRTSDISQKLIMLRKAHGLSQRKLAKRSGVSNGTISIIENGGNLTVSMLKKILNGIPMSLSQFFAEDVVGNDPKIFFSKTELTELSEGGVSFKQVGGDLYGKAIQLLSETYAPGATTGHHALRHDGEECGMILTGYLTVTVGEKTQTLGPGDAYYFHSSAPHSFKNDGIEVCRLISACTPPTF
ncbi:MAG: cupin domain-containing protein [Kordiimonadaceae bacterium]|nr:cupin domain-containing protein [Kordiimonadaceae bacterium]